MPSASTLTIADNVPANHSFTPFTVSMGLTSFVCREGTTPAGNMTITYSMSPATTARKTYRVKTMFNFPVEQTVDGVVSVRSVARRIIEDVIPADFSAAERLKYERMAESVAINALTRNYTVDLDPAY